MAACEAPSRTPARPCSRRTRSREGAPLAAVARHALPDRPGADDPGQRPRRVRRRGRRGRRAAVPRAGADARPGGGRAAGRDPPRCSATGPGASASSASSRRSCAPSSSRSIRAHRPPFALIAGGRPDQARALEDEGIATYLHVPSPGLLQLYLRRRPPVRVRGARVRRPRRPADELRAVGHDGPHVCSRSCRQASSDCHVLFAGGIHDATLGGDGRRRLRPLAARGVRVGVLLGTAYLFTPEAVECGAITPAFQEAAVAGDRPCCWRRPGPRDPLPAVAVRRGVRGREAAGCAPRASPAEELRDRLERLNLGRLRIASKGVDRDPRSGSGPDGPKLVAGRSRRAVGARHVHDRPGRRAARPRRDARRAAPRRVARAAASCCARLPAPRPRRSRPCRRPPTSRSSGSAASCRARPTSATFWSNILDKVDAITEVPADRWDWRRYLRPRPAARDKVYSRWGGFVDDGPFDPLRSACRPNSLRSIEPFQLLALVDRPGGAARRRLRHRPFARERTSVILGAGGGGADLAVGYTVRSALPSLLGDEAPELQRGARRAACRSGPRTLRRPADERRRRPDRQPARPRRRQLHRRRRLRVVAGRRRPRRRASCRPARATWCSPAASTRSRTRSPTSASARRTRSRRTAAAARSTRPPTASRSARASPPSCSSGWPTPSATATASTP